MDWGILQKKFDKNRVFEFTANFPEQLRQAIKIGKAFSAMESNVVSKIVFCGMGGSGSSGRIVKSIVQGEIAVPIEIVADYSLPNFVDANTLVVAVSFSGNTEETIACFEEAKKKGAKVVGITSNGTLAKIAEHKIVVPSAPQPRLALPSLSVPIFFVLSNYNLISSKEKELVQCSEFLAKEKSSIEKTAKTIALKLKGKFPVIYAASKYEGIAYRFRCELNENSKVLALHHVLPEMNHNEINAEDLPKNSCFALLRNINESPKMQKRFEFTKKTFSAFPNIEIWLKGSNPIEENYYGVFTFAMAAYYLALLNKKDPNEIPVIAKLKNELKK